MKIFLISFFSLVVIVICGFGAHLIYLYYHCEFKPPDFYHSDLIESTLVQTPASESLKQEVRQLLNQEFVYLGKGRQMTVYESKDHQCVIKFFNPRTFLRKSWFSDIKRLRRMSSLRWISRAYFKRTERLMRLSYRHQLAFDEMKEEAGLIYVHLNAATKLTKSLSVQDQEGKYFLINLDEVPFVIQKKATVIFTAFDSFMQRGEIDKIKEGLSQLYVLFNSRAHLGITDRLQTLHNNYGFSDGKAIQIDVGGIMKDNSIKIMPEIEVKRIFSNFVKPISKLYPDVIPFLYEIIDIKREL
jgi:hypothetical protein